MRLFVPSLQRLACTARVARGTPNSGLGFICRDARKRRPRRQAGSSNWTQGERVESLMTAFAPAMQRLVCTPGLANGKPISRVWFDCRDARKWPKGQARSNLTQGEREVVVSSLAATFGSRSGLVKIKRRLSTVAVAQVDEGAAPDVFPGNDVGLSSASSSFSYIQQTIQSKEKNFDVQSVPELQQRTEEWHNLRKGRITASAFGNALGLWNRGRVELWEEKIGLRQPFAGNGATRWGTEQESTAVDKYKEITGNLVEHMAFKIYKEGDDLQAWLGASPDGLVDSNASKSYERGGLLEVKCPHNKGSPEHGVPWPAVPHYYMPQAQGLLEIFDRDWMDFYVWCLNGSVLFRIQRDPGYWGLIFRVMSEYWWGNIVPAKHALMDGKGIEGAQKFKPALSHPLTDIVVRESRLLATSAPLVWKDVHREGTMIISSSIVEEFYSL